MKTLILFVLFLIPLLCYSQKEAETLYDQAYECSWKYRYANNDTTILLDPLYDSAIILLNKLQSKYPNYRKNDVEEIYQDCYFYSKDYLQSLKYSLKILSRFTSNDVNSEEYCVECRFACIKAAKSYLNLKNYTQAINYYDSSLTKYKTYFLVCGLGERIDNAYRDKDLFFAYLGLKNPKKALEIATPYFFDSTMTQYIDSSYSTNYFKAVRELFSFDDAKKDVNVAMDSLNIKLGAFFKSNKTNLHKNNWVQLFGAKIDLLEELKYGEVLDLFFEIYTKDYLLHRVMSSVGYQYFNSIK